MVGARRHQPAGARLWDQGIGGEADRLPGRRFLRRPDVRAVGRPQAVVGDRQERIVTDDRPHQAAGRVREAGNRVPGRGGRPVDAEPHPAVPRQILELERAHDDCRVEARLRVDRDVLDPAGEVVGVELAPQPIADHRAVATARERLDQIALEADAVRVVVRVAVDKQVVDLVGALGVNGVTDRRAEQMIGLEPAVLRPWRSWPGIEGHTGIALQRIDRHLAHAHVPRDPVGPFIPGE